MVSLNPREGITLLLMRVVQLDFEIIIGVQNQFQPLGSAFSYFLFLHEFIE